MPGCLPSEDLAFLPTDSDEGKQYIEDMNLALDYAKENRRRIMESFMAAVAETFADVFFETPVNIHHNYAALENHFGANLWVHREGATAARAGGAGIIPGSMGTPSYIAEGLGNEDAFISKGAYKKIITIIDFMPVAITIVKIDFIEKKEHQHGAHHYRPFHLH